MQYLIVFTR